MSGPWTTIEGIKSVVAYRWGIPVDQQRLLTECPNDCNVNDPVKSGTKDRHFILLPLPEAPPRKRKKEKEHCLLGQVSDSD